MFQQTLRSFTDKSDPIGGIMSRAVERPSPYQPFLNRHFGIHEPELCSFFREVAVRLDRRKRAKA